MSAVYCPGTARDISSELPNQVINLFGDTVRLSDCHPFELSFIHSCGGA